MQYRSIDVLKALIHQCELTKSHKYRFESFLFRENVPTSISDREPVELHFPLEHYASQGERWRHPLFQTAIPPLPGWWQDRFFVQTWPEQLGQSVDHKERLVCVPPPRRARQADKVSFFKAGRLNNHGGHVCHARRHGESVNRGL